MGLKWFRARLSMNKKEYKVPVMTGIYRRVSYAESNALATRKNEHMSPTVISSIANDSNANDKEQQYDRAKEDLVSQSPSSNVDNKSGSNVIQNKEPTASMRDSNAEESLMSGEETNKSNEEQSHVSNTKDRVCEETELVI